MKTLLIATTNKGKVAELSALLKGFPYQVIGLADLPESYPVVEETGSTFRDNAILKAVYYSEKSGLLTLADDSGLEVDALDGRPGVFSARYGGEDSTSAEQIGLLLSELNGLPVEKRTARFICSIALADKNLIQVFEASCEGRIGFEPRGHNGFGYDPIFIDFDSGRTFAELTKEEKSSRSHRGKALLKAMNFLAELR